MKTLQILMPMGGLGSRFAKAGFETPKPLILVDGVPMFRKAISSLDGLSGPRRHTFVIRQEHADSLGLGDLITEALPGAEVVIIPELTRGAAETALMAKNVLNPDDPLVIMDCDLWFTSQSYNDMVLGVLEGTSDLGGGVQTFAADNPRYSYAELDDDDMVLRTAEKKVISDRAMTGAYFFARASTFTDAAEELLKRPLSDEMPEYYISYIYNLLLEQGHKIKAGRTDEFASFGTPEELEAYEGR